MFTFTVTPDGRDPFEATATSRDVNRWEKGGKGRSLERLANAPTMGDLYSLAFVAVSRLGMFDGDLREFEADCDLTFENAVDEDGVPATVPTRPGR